MISAIVLSPDPPGGRERADAAEVIVRSLVWLVSAVVSGVVQEVILAAPDRLDLTDVVDQSGCGLVQAAVEADRLAAAVAASRGRLLFVVRSGFLPDPGLVDELAALLRRAPGAGAGALLLATPETPWERLLPDRAPAVGILVARATITRPGTFAQMAKASRHAARLRSRASRIA